VIGDRYDPLGDAFELRALRIALLLHVLLAIGLCFVPLFDVLGFERALASGLLAGPTSAAIGVSMVRAARLSGGGDLARLASYAIGISLLLLVPTMVAGIIVELANQPCDQEQGFLFLLLVAGGNALFGAALGIAAATISARRFLPGILIAAVFILFLTHALYSLYSEPQIFIYSVPLGFWPGSLYDEELSVSPALWAFRGFTLLAAFALVAFVRMFADARTVEVSFARPRVTALLGTMVLALVAIAVYRNGERLGFDLSRGTIERELSRRVRSEHFDLFISPSVTPEQVARLEEDHELRYRQLTRFFGYEPEGRIKSFVYANADEKARLMGAANTQIARPWAQEIHINGFDVPHNVLKHELAHVFAATIATGTFKTPATAGIFVNIGVVEGIAVAADWPASELTVHGWTRAMRALKLSPDPRTILNPAGFWAISSARAYTVAGSFIRWLVDTEGMKKFAVLYATNDFSEAYGRSLDSLVDDWEKFVDAEPLPKEELAIAEHRFKRPGIFQKVCAHKAANLSREGYERLHSGDLEGGIERLEQLLGYSPAAIAPLVDISEAYAKAGRLDEARRYAKRAYETPAITEKNRAEALEALGGLDWREGELERAKKAFEEVLAVHLSSASERLQQARLLALSRSAAEGDVLKRLLIGELTGAKAMVELGAISRSHPDDTLVRYLYGRQLEAAGAFTEGIVELEAAVQPGTLPGPLHDEAEMTLGRLLLRGARPDEAEAHFRALAARASSAVVRLTAEDWAERAAFVTARVAGARSRTTE
jgi:tetratricopeptide (TPR) repeat protein